MIPELGHLALILALLAAAVLGTLPLVGAGFGDRAPIVEWVRLARPAAQVQFLFVAVSWICLVLAFAGDDFSVVNVASNSNSQLPMVYKITAAWGSHEGSMLLWILMLALWTAAVSVFSRHLPAEMLARVLGVMGLVSIGFILFTLLTSNPFERLL